MVRYSAVVFLLLADLAALTCPVEKPNMPNPESELTIRSGTYLGECFVDCNETVTLTRDTTRYSLTSNVRDPEHPDIEGESPTQPEEWSKISELADFGKLASLPDKIGDPDANDAGGEWIEVARGSETKRVDFPLGSAPPELKAFAEELREIRQRLSEAHGRK